ncbi:pilus assembly protein TadG-related protein [Alcaligenes nematophilus]|uniref:pilus assembly protein TadG-related protein n=1 Tax=Alcaligenes nematophilus TaxID=2994643 RepID=UPI0034E074B3
MKWGRTRTQSEQAHKQQGSIIVPAAAALLVGLVLLGAAHLGHNFHVKRGLQNAADLAALAGAQALGSGDALGCQQGESMARFSLNSQPDSPAAGLTGDGAKVFCGKWNSSHSDPAQRFVSSLPADSVRVHLSYQPPSLFPFFTSSVIEAVATAKNSEPVATFSVGSRLLSLKRNGLVYNLLRGVGLRPDQLTVLDSAGLVNAKITPSGLLKALGLPATVIAGVGTPEELARLEQLTLADLLSASLALLDQQKTLGLDVGALQEYIRLLLGVGPLDLPVKLLGEGGILALIDGVDPLSALNVNLDVLQLVNTGLVVANGKNLIDLNLTALPSGLTNMFNNALDLRVRIVEPPSIAMGGIGTKANSAGVRVYLNLDTSKIPLVGLILNALGTRVSLPVIIELSQASGELVNVCRAPIAENQATIAVKSSLVNVCLGKFPHSDFFSTSNSCKDESFGGIQRHQVINVLGILPLTAKVTLPLIDTKNPVHVTLTAPPGEPSEATVNATQLDLSRSVSLLSDAVLSGILGDLLNTPWSGASGKRQMAESLVGGGAGRSVSEVVNEMNWSKERMDQLARTMSQNGLIGVLGGTLGFVDNLLTTLLGAPLSDLACVIGGIGGQQAMRECRTGAVEVLVFKDSNLVGAVLSLVVALLDPVLQGLSALLEGLLKLLGLSLVEADVKLHDVQCGTAYLVQ